MSKPRKPIVAANWKMFKTPSETADFFKTFLPVLGNLDGVDIVIAPPFPCLPAASEHAGSWWPQWAAFLAEHGGKDVKPPARLGSAAFTPLEPAPGRYVKVRAD